MEKRYFSFVANTPLLPKTPPIVFNQPRTQPGVPDCAYFPGTLNVGMDSPGQARRMGDPSVNHQEDHARELSLHNVSQE